MTDFITDIGSQIVRQELKMNLAKCTEEHHNLFRRMYSHENLELGIDDVVDKIPNDKLNWALQQVLNTLKKVKQ